MENIRDLKRLVLWLAATMVIIHGLGCVASDGEKEPGTELGPCYSNSTCNTGLVCASGLCVMLPPLDSAPIDQGLDSTDSTLPDLPAPDLPAPDLPAPDLPVPDLPVPDLPVPDLPVPDLPTLDLLKDLALDNGTTPDLGLVDQAIQPDGSTPSKWLISAGGALIEQGESIAVDSLGNSYVTGFFQSTLATFGSTTLTSASMGQVDPFFAKVDSSGNFVWAVSAVGAGSNSGHSIAVDGSGNSYFTGYFEYTATFGSTTLTSNGGKDIFVAKLDSGGKFIWAISADGNGNTGSSIAVDSSSNSYLTGSFSGTSTFGSTILTSNGGNDIFVAKLDSGGKFVWATSAGGTDGSVSHSIALDGSGNSYIAGEFWDAVATFGSTTLTGKSYGSPDIFIAKVDSGGKFIWAASAGGTDYDMAFSIGLDGSGNSYVTGVFGKTATFGSTMLTSSIGSSTFIAKVDSGGKFVWAVSPGRSDSSAIAVDGSGNSYITGVFGYAWNPTFGSTTLTSKGLFDLFVAKLDSGGKFVWAASAGGMSDDVSRSIAIDGSGNSYITGFYEGMSTFGSAALTSKGKQDLFVAKLDKNGKFLN